MFPKKNPTESSVKKNVQKNKSKSIVSYNNPILNSIQKVNRIINMKKELIGRTKKDKNLNPKKASRNTQIQSIDNSAYNQNINSKSSITYNKNINNNNHVNKDKDNNQGLKQKITKKKNSKFNNITILKETKKNAFNNVKRMSAKYEAKNYKNLFYQNTQNSNYSKSSDLLSEIIPQNDKKEESKDDLSKIINNINSNSKHLTTYVQIDDLTPIPNRVGFRQHYLAEYDYDEAKRAAVTCRRIEYSYNLRNVIKSEISLDEIIRIQRWWREILKKRYFEFLKELKIQENIRNNCIEKYILFINKIHYVYVMHLVHKFIDRLKKRFGKLYYKNFFNKKAAKIQKAYKLFIAKRKLRKQLKLKAFLTKLYFQKRKKIIFFLLFHIINKMKKIIKLQHFVKYYLLKKNESYYLNSANIIHPFMYYHLKYGVGKNDKKIFLIKYKISNFMYMIQTWKNFVKSKKMLRCLNFIENITFIIKKKYFIFFILLVVERINSMITYFLLNPLMKDILYIYYRKKLQKIIKTWKDSVKKMKQRDVLALNNIIKIIYKFAFKQFFKLIKKLSN